MLAAISTAGMRRHTKPICTDRPDDFAASMMRSQAGTLVAIGFSSSTCLPAFSDCTASGSCRSLGTAMTTPSTSALARSRSRLGSSSTRGCSDWKAATAAGFGSHAATTGNPTRAA
jgi:hypothetical protein